MAERVRSFAPVASADARVLILGSMPGVASLNAGQYYAHPQNRFWPIMGRLLGFDPANTSYAQRTAYLTAAGVALWDVLQSCERSGSLDSAIRRETQRVNDFSAFFAAHPKMRAVYFNGAHAAQVFARVVLPTLADRPDLQFVRLPSTSPAHASRSFEDKLAEWRQILATDRRPVLRD
jgi:hypoxanthine-DNA glycosylase